MRQLGRGLVALVLGAGTVVVAGVAAPSPVLADEACAKSGEQPLYATQTSYALSSIGVPQTWPLATGKGVVVAVVDSGVDYRNAHLGSAVMKGTSFLPYGARDGREDAYGHGTAIAGIIAARYLPQQRSALIGVARDARILPVRVFYQDKSADDPDAQVTDPPSAARTAAGIRWAVDHGAQVINVSISVSAQDKDLPELKAAVALARRRDVVVVASAGNNLSGQAQDRPTTRYPAGSPGVIGVAASNVSGSVDDYSTHGPQVAVAAPGANVLTTYLNLGDCLSGTQPYTSYATGFVSGLAAQLRQRFPRETAAQIAYRIEASADRPRQGERDDVEGWGVIQPYDALTMTLDPHRPGPPLPGAATSRGGVPKASAVEPVRAGQDPLGPARQESLWWGVGAVGLGALALVLRPLTGRTWSRRRT